jgi:hypothetical protein
MLLLSGCGAGNNQGNNSRGQIDAPVDIRYIISNPLTFSEVAEEGQLSGIKFAGKYLQISGLFDQQIEEKINGRLKDMYELYKSGEIPQEALDKYDGLECAGQNISFICYGNINNFLSVSMRFSWMFGELSGGRPPAYDGYYGETITYNVDLNTGDDISLKEVFADNVDYKSMIKDRAETVLIGQGVEVNDDIMAESLMQYLENPQFTLNDGFLYIENFIYNGPSYSEGQANEIYFDLLYNENFAVTKRFYDPDKSIYIDGNNGEKSIMAYVGEEESWEKGYIEDDINISVIGSYQREFPEHVKQAIRAEETPDNELISQMKQVLEDPRNKGAYAQYNKTVNSSHMQDFFNIWIYENADIYLEKTETSLLYQLKPTLKCYRKESDEPVKIRDLFHKDVDVDKILETAVFNKLEADQKSLEESGLQRSINVAAHASGAADKFAGFCVNHIALHVEYLGDPALPPYVIELKYSEIGYENLNIFD